MKHLLSNIKTVEVFDASELRESVIVRDRGIILRYVLAPQKISLNGLASCEISDKIQNNQKIFSINLQMHCCSRLDDGGHHLCFRLTTVSGSQFIMGTVDRPYPVISNNEFMPSAPTAQSGVKVTVTLDSFYPLLAVLN